MDARVKQLWIDALTGKSKKKYTQAIEILRNGNSYCCLGVLCDLYRQENKASHWAKRDNGTQWFTTGKKIEDYDGAIIAEESDVDLPKAVADWAGINSSSGYISEHYSLPKSTLAELNDFGLTFEDIAKVIEEHF